MVADAPSALRQISVLVAALEEVEEYNPRLGANSPPPALWSNRPAYLQDVKELLRELRQLNELLQADLEDRAASEKAAKNAGLVVSGAKKFVESYCDAMGKGAAALTVAGVAYLCASLGADKGAVESVWSLLKPGK